MADLAGLRALIVEDEGGIALLVEDMLLELGCEIAASVAHLDAACAVARTTMVDFAVLDVNLDGRPAFPVAHILRAREVPFVFSTGYGASGLPDEFKGQPVLGKPFGIEELHRAVTVALGAGN